jgi:hypothetical protein
VFDRSNGAGFAHDLYVMFDNRQYVAIAVGTSIMGFRYRNSRPCPWPVGSRTEGRRRPEACPTTLTVVISIR